MPIRIRQATTRAGELLELGGFTVLVGPNNCGKSQTLRDIKSFISTGSSARMKSLQALAIELPTMEEGLAQIRKFPEPQSPGHVRFKGVSDNLNTSHEFVVPENWAVSLFQDRATAANQAALLQQLGKYWVAHLDAKGRFQLTAPSPAYNTRTEAPSNALQKFYEDRAVAQPQLREAFTEAFGVDIALDWAAMKDWYLRVGERFGELPEAASDLDAMLRDKEDLSEQGDGYQSFAGVALSMLTFSDRVLLLDEPEAFLHPAQARVLGRWLARTARGRAAQVVVATHSADLLLGILSADTEASVIRLNRQAGESKYSTIPAAVTSGLIQSPLLSSQPVLDALFHKGVVVCEGDPDRAVYQTVAHQLLRSEGGDEVLFIHTNGKDAAKGPAKLLSQAGVPVCSVVDIDAFNSSQPLCHIVEALTGDELNGDLEALRQEIATVVEEAPAGNLLSVLMSSVSEWLGRQHIDVRTARKGLVTAANAGKSKWSRVKTKGVDYFEGEAKAKVELLVQRLALLGVFVVPCGELEGWLRLGLDKGQLWNRTALQKIHDGECPPALKAFVAGMLSFLIAPTTPAQE